MFAYPLVLLLALPVTAVPIQSESQVISAAEHGPGDLPGPYVPNGPNGSPNGQ